MVNALGVVVVAGTSTPVVAPWGGAQGFGVQVTVGGYTPFLVAGLEDNDHLLVQPSRSSDPVLAAQGTGVGNDEESSVAGECSFAEGRPVGGPELQPRSRPHEKQ